jgi:large conductance mechanosensitive channel
MLDEFKKFAMRGNVVDFAVGVIIGAAFGAIVSSLVNDIIMPVIGAITGGLDFSNYYTALSSKVKAGLSYADAKKQGAVLGWGQFLTVTLNFLIIAWALFMTIKGINRLKKEEPPPPAPGPAPEVLLLTEIRDLLQRHSASGAQGGGEAG